MPGAPTASGGLLLAKRLRSDRDLDRDYQGRIYSCSVRVLSVSVSRIHSHNPQPAVCTPRMTKSTTRRLFKLHCHIPTLPACHITIARGTNLLVGK